MPFAPGTADGAPVWTGQEFVVWGGSQTAAVNTGVAYRPTTNRWRALAASPLSSRYGHSAVWTGNEILYWGGSSSDGVARNDGASYRPMTDEWRPLPTAPFAVAFHIAVWTGREMVVWGGDDHCCSIDSVIHGAKTAAYDPALRKWRQLPDVPAPWSGDDGPAISGTDAGHLWIWRHDHLGQLDLATNNWSDLGSPPPRNPGAAPRCEVTGGPISVGAFTATRLVVWTGGCRAEDGWAFDLRARRWTKLAQAPRDAFVSIVTTPDVFAVLAGDDARLARYDEATGAWREISSPPPAVGSFPIAVWTGTEILLWRGFRTGHELRTGATYRP